MTGIRSNMADRTEGAEDMSEGDPREADREEQDLLKNVTLWKDRKHFMWFPFSFTKYEVRNNRLYSQQGFFNTTYDEVLLYRILDISMTQTFAQKLFGTGTLTLCARANRGGDVVLENIKNPRKVNELLSDLVEEARDKKRVVGKEFYGSDDHTHMDDQDVDDWDDDSEDR